jgi:hypothetical protein
MTRPGGNLPGRFAFLLGETKCSKGANMTLQPPLEGLTDYRLSDRSRIIQALAEFRQEWEIAAVGKSLVTTESPVGLLLSDIADWLDLSPQERHAMLGNKLINEVNALLEDRIRLKQTS